MTWWSHHISFLNRAKNSPSFFIYQKRRCMHAQQSYSLIKTTTTTTTTVSRPPITRKLSKIYTPTRDDPRDTEPTQFSIPSLNTVSIVSWFSVGDKGHWTCSYPAHHCLWASIPGLRLFPSDQLTKHFCLFWPGLYHDAVAVICIRLALPKEKNKNKLSFKLILSIWGLFYRYQWWVWERIVEMPAKWTASQKGEQGFQGDNTELKSTKRNIHIKDCSSSY